MTLRTLRRWGFATMVAIAAAPVPVIAQSLPPGVKKGPSVEGITEYQLDNGLKVLLFPDQSKPTVTVNITYLVGSRHEGYGETGMAHLLEHLVFKGTPKHPNIPEELTSHGARPNGTTWYDRTNYFETVPATAENLEWALDLEADRMVNSYIAKKDLESEFTVVRNEFESGENDPFGVLLERMMSTMFLWHNYGKSTIGARADIENVPIERLKAFYQKYYQPDNAILVVAGKFDEGKTLGLIQQKFGAIPRPERSLARGNLLYPTYTRDPVQDGERQVTLRRVGDVQVVMAGYHVPAGAHPDYPAVDVLNQLLSDEPGGRIYKALVEPKLAASAGSLAFQFAEPGILAGFANVRQEQSLDSARAALVATLEGFAAKGATADEVERAKRTLLKNIELALNSSERVGLELSEWASMADWRMLFVHRDRIEKVTPADVQRVAAAYLKPQNRTLGLFHPTAKPDRAEIPEVTVADVAAVVSSYKGRAVVAAGEAFEATPDNVEQRTTRTKLANGFTLAMLPKQTRGNSVRAVVTMRFGSEQSLTGRATEAGLIGSMLDKGTKTKSRQQIKDEFDKLKARVFFGGAGNNVVANIETTRPNLEPTLKLVAEVLRTPAFDAKEFELLVTENVAGLEQAKTEPQVLASVAMQQKMNPWPKGHPLYTSSIEENISDLKAAKVENVRKIYTELVGASYGDLAIVGDFDKDSVQALAGSLFGDWKSPKPFARLPRKVFAVQPFNEQIKTPDKANAFFVAGQAFPLRDDSPDYAAYALANYIFGGGFLNSRLAVRIRQKDGISYGVGSQGAAASLDSVGTFTAFAIYAPENVAKLESAFGEEVARAIKDGFTAEEVAAAKSGWLQQRTQSRANDAQLVGQFSAQYLTKRTMAYDKALEEQVAALTPEQVSAAFRKYIVPGRMSMVKAGDFDKKPAAPKVTP